MEKYIREMQRRDQRDRHLQLVLGWCGLCFVFVLLLRVLFWVGWLGVVLVGVWGGVGLLSVFCFLRFVGFGFAVFRWRRCCCFLVLLSWFFLGRSVVFWLCFLLVGFLVAVAGLFLCSSGLVVCSFGVAFFGFAGCLLRVWVLFWVWFFSLGGLCALVSVFFCVFGFAVCLPLFVLFGLGLFAFQCCVLSVVFACLLVLCFFLWLVCFSLARGSWRVFLRCFARSGGAAGCALGFCVDGGLLCGPFWWLSFVALWRGFGSFAGLFVCPGLFFVGCWQSWACVGGLLLVGLRFCCWLGVVFSGPLGVLRLFRAWCVCVALVVGFGACGLLCPVVFLLFTCWCCGSASGASRLSAGSVGPFPSFLPLFVCGCFLSCVSS